MDILKIIIGFLIGAPLVPAIAWLVFVYPFSEVSLKGALWGFTAGVISGAVVLMVVMVWAGLAWPGD